MRKARIAISLSQRKNFFVGTTVLDTSECREFNGFSEEGASAALSWPSNSNVRQLNCGDGEYNDLGVDAVIGQHASPGPQRWPYPVDPPVTMANFVTLKGGEYFFAPSVDFLQNIAEI